MLYSFMYIYIGLFSSWLESKTISQSDDGKTTISHWTAVRCIGSIWMMPKNQYQFKSNVLPSHHTLQSLNICYACIDIRVHTCLIYVVPGLPFRLVNSIVHFTAFLSYHTFHKQIKAMGFTQHLLLLVLCTSLLYYHIYIP